MNRTKAALALLGRLLHHGHLLDTERDEIARVLAMPESESEALAREVDDLLERGQASIDVSGHVMDGP